MPVAIIKAIVQFPHRSQNILCRQTAVTGPEGARIRERSLTERAVTRAHLPRYQQPTAEQILGVLPVNLAEAVRQMSGGGGDTHNYTVQAWDGRSVMDAFLNNGRTIASAVASAQSRRSPRQHWVDDIPLTSDHR
jgi:hypothetical protein